MISGTYSRGTKYTCAAVITFSDNTTKTLSESDFATGNNGFVDGAGASSFPLGVAIERSITVEIQNDGSYENKTFVGAVITFYAKYGNNTLALGKFTVLEPETYGETIIISAVDDMYKADKPYSTELEFPVTLQALFNDACASCGIANGSSSFSHNDFQVSGIESGKYTFREIFGFIAMIAGGNARINRSGQMQILSYGLSATPSVNLKDWQSLKTDYNDVTITGLKAVVGEGDESQTYSYGNAGYVLELKNPFFTDDNAETALALIAQYVVDYPFRKFEGDHVADPFIEFMDVVYIVDRKGNQYKTVITDVDFTFFGVTTLKNSAESALRNESYYVSGNTKTLIEAQKAVQRETTARETAIAQLQQAIANASGMYSTDVTQPDQSVIRYLHDKPTLAASTNILKITSEAIAISKDGGATYPYGVTFNGDFIANILSASGVNADWINTGALVVRNNDTTVFQADCDTGSVSINGSAGNVQFTNCPFTTIYSKTFLASNYTESDFYRLRDIVGTHTITPTPEDYEKYDFDLDGSLSQTDFIILRNMIMIENPYGDLTTSFYVSIPASGSQNLLHIYSTRTFANGSSSTKELFNVSNKGAEFGPRSTTMPYSMLFRCAVNSGGYSVHGKKIEVQTTITITTALSGNDYWRVLNGFPEPFAFVSLSACRINGGTGNEAIGCNINTSGEMSLTLGSQGLADGDQVCITGSYWIS